MTGDSNHNGPPKTESDPAHSIAWNCDVSTVPAPELQDRSVAPGVAPQSINGIESTVPQTAQPPGRELAEATLGADLTEGTVGASSLHRPSAEASETLPERNGEAPGHVRPSAYREHSTVDELSQTDVVETTRSSGLGPQQGVRRDREHSSRSRPSGSEPVIGSFADYELLEKIARGGMGIVYKARQKKPHRIVALKTILAGTLASTELVERFYLEAEAAAALEHPGIVPIYEVGEFHGQHFFSMGYVEGGSLHSQLNDGPLPPRRAAGLIMQASEAVGYANDRGIIHRDIKPGNILLDKNGQPKVTDFGVAKNVSSDSHLTMDGQIIGTASYMPPEQARGHISEITPASDVYSLGATLYCLVTGRPPFQAATTFETIDQVIKQEPVSPRQLNAAVNRDLETICLKCLQKEPGKRYPRAQDLADDLRRFVSGEPILARPVSPSERLWRWARRNPVVAALTILSAFLLFAGTIVSSVFAVRAQFEANASSAARRLSDRRWYVAEMNLAYQDWKAGHINLVQERLKQHGAPPTGEKDLRGFEWYYLDSLCHLDLATMQGHEGPVRCLAIGPDGAIIASAASALGRPNEVILWNLAGARQIRRFEAPGGQPQRLVFTPDGKRLALAVGDPGRPSEIQIWDVARAHLDHTLHADSGAVCCLVFRPDGKSFASAGEGGTIRIWNTSTGLIERELEGHKLTVVGIAFIADGKTLASVSQDETVRVWETTTGRQMPSTKLRIGDLRAAAFSPDGKTLATCGDDARVRIWNLPTGQETASFTGAIDQIDRLVYSLDGRRLAASGDGPMAQVWQVEDRSSVVLRGHSETVFDLAFSPDGWRIATAGADATVKLWNAVQPLETRVLASQDLTVHAVAFSPDGRSIASAGNDGTLRIWDRATGRETAIMKGHYGQVADLSFDARGDRLVSAGLIDGTVRVWDARTGNALLVLHGHTSPVCRARFSPDGREILSSSHPGLTGTMKNGGELKVRNATTGEERITLALEPSATPGSGLRAACYSPDGKWIAASLGNSIQAWNAANGAAAWTLRGHDDVVFTIAFSADSGMLASAGMDQTVKLWNIQTGKEIRTLRGHSAKIVSVAFSPDHERLASASGGQYRSGSDLPAEVKLWDTATGQEVLSLHGRGKYASDVTFSPDGRAIASANADGTVTIWDTLPESDDERLARHASMLVQFLFGQGLTAGQVQDRIRDDPTIDEAMRREARYCIEDLEHKAISSSAEKAVRELLAKPRFKQEVIEHLQQDRSLPEAAKREALALAERRWESPPFLDKAGFAVARTPASDASLYRLALQQAETAHRRSPFETRYQITMGMAQYRLRDFAAALDTLARADQATSPLPQGSSPASLAFLAMTQYQLGQSAQARSTLDRLQESMKRPEWAPDNDAQAFLREAEALIGSQPRN